MAASLVQKEEQFNDQGNRQESSDPHEYEEDDDSTETEDDEDEEDEEDDDDDDEDDEDDEDDDDVADDDRGHNENVEGIITKADFNTNSEELGSLLGSNNDKERNL